MGADVLMLDDTNIYGRETIVRAKRPNEAT
jgi:hypothetical protein